MTEEWPTGLEGTDLWSPDVGITQSMLASWQQCRRRSSFELAGYQAVPPGPPVALLYGELIHALLEELYRRMAGGVPDESGAPVDEIRARYASEFSSGAAMETIEHWCAVAGAVAQCYEAHYTEDGEWGWIASEHEFDYRLGPHRLRGKIDGLFRAKDGSLWILETKTRGQMPAGLDESLTFDLQNLFYALAVKGTWGEAPQGVLHNVVRRPQLKVRKDENLQDLTERIIKDVPDRPEFYFRRFEISLDPDLERFRRELLWKLQEFMNWRAGALATWRNETGCVGRGFCRYLRACASGSLAGYRQRDSLHHELEED